ncbi:hypothetical protein [Eubacterium sp.]|uniref:hypothetical protein n=1 Tax=Eubacterium sp. TaxID=142586 RepID=UPI002FCABE04
MKVSVDDKTDDGRCPLLYEEGIINQKGRFHPTAFLSAVRQLGIENIRKCEQDRLCNEGRISRWVTEVQRRR